MEGLGSAVALPLLLEEKKESVGVVSAWGRFLKIDRRRQVERDEASWKTGMAKETMWD